MKIKITRQEKDTDGDIIELDEVVNVSFWDSFWLFLGHYLLLTLIFFVIGFVSGFWGAY